MSCQVTAPRPLVPRPLGRWDDGGRDLQPSQALSRRVQGRADTQESELTYPERTDAVLLSSSFSVVLRQASRTV